MEGVSKSGFLSKVQRAVRSPRGGKGEQQGGGGGGGGVTFEGVAGLIGGSSAEEVRAMLMVVTPPERLQQLLQERDGGWTLFHLATQLGRLQSAFVLLQLGAEVNASTPNGSTGLHFLALLGKPECQPSAVYLQLLTELLRQGALFTLNHAGESVLHMATSRKNDLALNFFLEAGCDVNVQTKRGETALHYAVTYNCPTIVARLLESGARDRPNNDSETAFDLAVRLGNQEICHIFEAAAAATADTHLLERSSALTTAGTGGGPSGLGGGGGALNVSSSTRGAAAAAAAAAVDASGGVGDLHSSQSASGAGGGGALSSDTPLSPGREDEIIVWMAPEQDPFADESMTLSSSEEDHDGSLSELRVMGSWEVYRNEFFGKRHHVFHGTASGAGKGRALVVLMVRADEQGQHRGLLIGGGDWISFRVAADQLLLYTGGDDVHQMVQVLSAHRSTSAWVWRPVRKTPHLINGSLLLALEAKLALRPRICIGVVLGLPGQLDEETMFENRGQRPPEFEAFLNVLGEHIEVGEWPHWKGTFTGTEESQEAYYCSWRGFEIVLHVATLMDASMQRQHIGNDTVLIFYKMGDGTESVQPVFRGKVNALGLVVRPSPSVGNRALTLSAFYRGWIEGFTPALPGSAISIAKPALLREILFTNALNATQAAVRSGPYRVNRLRLYDSSIAELLTAEEIEAEGAAVEGDSPSSLSKIRSGRLSPRKKERPLAASSSNNMPSSSSSASPVVAIPISSVTVNAPSAQVVVSAPISGVGKSPSSHDLNHPVVLASSSNAYAVAALEASNDDSDVLLSGWLNKRRPRQKALASTWKKRWVIAKDQGLSYFDKETFAEDERLGTIPYASIQVVELHAMHFSVQCVGSEFEFGTCSEGSELRTWALLLASQAGVDLHDLAPTQARVPPSRPQPRRNQATPLSPKPAPTPPSANSEELVLEAMELVQRRGLMRRNLFRVQEDESEADALAAAWQRGEKRDLEKIQMDVIAGGIRKYLRDLSSQLGLEELQQLVQSCKSSRLEDRIEALRSVLRDKGLLLSLFELLNKVDGKNAINKMTASNLAAVFAPTFLRAAEEQPPMLLLEYTKSVVEVVQLGIEHFSCCKLSSAEATWSHGHGEAKKSLPPEVARDADEHDTIDMGGAGGKGEIMVELDLEELTSPRTRQRNDLPGLKQRSHAPISPGRQPTAPAEPPLTSPKRNAPAAPKKRAPVPPSKKAPGPPPPATVAPVRRPQETSKQPAAQETKHRQPGTPAVRELKRPSPPGQVGDDDTDDTDDNDNVDNHGTDDHENDYDNLDEVPRTATAGDVAVTSVDVSSAVRRHEPNVTKRNDEAAVLAAVTAALMDSDGDSAGDNQGLDQNDDEEGYLVTPLEDDF